MQPEPTVSVIIPVLNGADTIGDTLTALVHQAGTPADPEIIVVDNGSTDGTLDVVRQFDVTWLTECKRGPSAARNRGLNHARGEVAAFLDADTVPTRRWLNEITSPFADSNVLLVGGQLRDYISRTPPERFMSQMGAFQFEYRIFREGFPHVSSSNMAVRRSAALAIQGWDETFLTAEDFDFTLRLVRHFRCPVIRPPGAILMNRHRRTDDGLRQQAWSYGEGLAKIHLRYPEIGRMDTARRFKLNVTLGVRRMKAVLGPIGARVGWTTSADAEFARYHWLWSRWFWRGFFSMLKYQEWRSL